MMTEQANISLDDDLKILQDELRAKGNCLSRAWTDLCSLLTTYQAKLMVKENQLEIIEKQIQARRKQLAVLKDGKSVPSSEELQEQLELKDQELSTCQSELFNATEMIHGVQAELVNQSQLLEKTRSENLEKEDMILHYQNRIAQLEADLHMKEELGEIKDNLIQKLQGQNVNESSDIMAANEEKSRLKELFDMQTKTLDAERKAHKETRRRLQLQQRHGSATSAKEQVATDSKSTSGPHPLTSTQFTSINEQQTSHSQGIQGRSTGRTNTDTAQQSMESKMHEAMSLYCDSYMITKNEDWKPKTSDSNTDQNSSNDHNMISSMNPGTLQAPVPISAPVPSTSILRRAAEEAGQLEAFRARNKGPRGVNNAYDFATLETAMHKVRSGEMSLRKAANFYHIPKTSLSTYVRELKKPGGRHGRGGCISLEDEREVIKLSLEHTKNGAKFGRKELLNLLAQYFDSKKMPNPFKCGLPGKDWWLNVRKRHPDLIQIKSKASNKSLAVKMQYVGELDISNSNASEYPAEDNESMNEGDTSGDLGLDVLRKAAGSELGEPEQQEVFRPLMNMDE